MRIPRVAQTREGARLLTRSQLLSSLSLLLSSLSLLLSSLAKRGIRSSQCSKEYADSASLMLLGMTGSFWRRSAQLLTLTLAVFALLGAGDESARVNDLGHRMMCVCGCNQILLECNHVGCAYSDRMRAELIAAVDRGDNDDMTLQVFIQKYGTTVMAAPTKTGFNRVAWIMPYLVLVLGLTMVTLIVRAWRSRPLVLPAGAVAAVHGAELEHFRDQARKDTEI
jgi:cytochrome c-type biogenesis protein CcmH/NrfF